jgi:hypothetical protein
MPRKFVEKRQKYSQESLRLAIVAVRSHNIPVSQAAKLFNLSRTTLSRQLAGTKRSSAGACTVFTVAQEKAIADMILYISHRGFPLTIVEVQSLAFNYAKTLKRRQQLQRGIPQAWQSLKAASYEW